MHACEHMYLCICKIYYIYIYNIFYLYINTYAHMHAFMHSPPHVETYNVLLPTCRLCTFIIQCHKLFGLERSMISGSVQNYEVPSDW